MFKFMIKILFALKTKVLNYYNRCVEEAMDKSWSTAREPNPNAFQCQDNFFVQWLNKK